MRLSIKTMYVSNKTDCFDFIAILAMEKSAITVIYLDEGIEPKESEIPITEFLNALVDGTRTASGREDLELDGTQDPYHKYSETGVCPNKSVYLALWGLAYEVMDDFGDMRVVRERNKVEQVLPHCYVFCRLNLAYLYHRGPETMGIRVSQNNTVETGFIDAAVYDVDREDTLHTMIIACAYVSESAMTDAWTDTSRLYPSYFDWKRGARGEWDDGSISDIFADEIVNYGARVLTGFWGLSPRERLSELLTRSNAQIGVNIFCPFFTDEACSKGDPTPFPLFNFIFGPYGKVKCQEEEHIPEWKSFAELRNLKIEEVCVDDEQIIVDQDETDFSPRGNAVEAHEHIQKIWQIVHFDQKTPTSTIMDESFIPLVKDHKGLDPPLPCKGVMRWFYTPWVERDVASKWDNWTELHWTNMVPHELMAKPFGQVKGCSIGKRVGDGQETRPQQRAWDMQVPGVVSYLLILGTSVSGQGSKQYRRQRLDYNRQQRASAPSGKGEKANKGKKKKWVQSAIAHGHGKKKKRKRQQAQ